MSFKVGDRDGYQIAILDYTERSRNIESTAVEESEKAERARALLDDSDLVMSVQVLQEFYVQATRADRTGALTHAEAVLFATSLTRFRIQDLTLPVLYRAFDYREKFGLSYWDCAILAAARESGCSEVYSEDFSHGQEYDGLRVINPLGPRRAP